MATATAEPDLAFSFLAPTGDEEAAPVETKTQEPPKSTPKPKTAPVVEDELEAEEGDGDAISEIAAMLMPTEEALPNKKAAKPEVKEEEPEPEPETKAAASKQPRIFNPQLLQLASSEGIGPGEAQEYASERALFGEIAARKMERQHYVGKSKTVEKEEPDDELPLPKFEWDEDTDPKIKNAVESVLTYAKAIKDQADAKVAKANEQYELLQSEHEQAAQREAVQTQAKVARMFDEKVAEWGEEFQELLGVPSQSYNHRGTPQYAEVRKLKNKALQLKAGYEMVTGSEATLDDISTFIDEARYALWPDRIQKAARTELSNGLKKQRGGVGLRPGRTRANDLPEQGDRAAKAGIAEKLAEFGLDPWQQARRSA